MSGPPPCGGSANTARAPVSCAAARSAAAASARRRRPVVRPASSAAPSSSSRPSSGAVAAPAGRAPGAIGRAAGSAFCSPSRRARRPEGTGTPCGGTVPPSPDPTAAVPAPCSPAITTAPSETPSGAPSAVAWPVPSAGLGLPRRRPVPPEPSSAPSVVCSCAETGSSPVACSSLARRLTAPGGSGRTGTGRLDGLRAGLPRHLALQEGVHGGPPGPPPATALLRGRLGESDLGGDHRSGAERNRARPAPDGHLQDVRAATHPRHLVRLEHTAVRAHDPAHDRLVHRVSPAYGPRTSIRTTSPRCAAATTTVLSM